MFAQNTNDGIFIISENPITKQDKKIICSDSSVRGKNLDDILTELCNVKGVSFVAEKDALYRVGNDVKRIHKNDKSIAESLVQNYYPDANYIGFLRKNKAVVPENPTDLLQILEKASKPELPSRRRKQLLGKIDELVNLYFSSNPLRGYKQKNVLKKARNIPEQTAYSRIKDSIVTFSNKSNRESKRKPILNEIKKLYSEDRYDILVHVDTDSLSRKSDIAEKLRKDIHAKEFFVFKNIPYIAIPCSKKDIDKICYSLNNKKGNYLSSHHFYKDSIARAQASDICYSPELFLEIASYFKFFRNFKGSDDSDVNYWNLKNIKAPEAWNITKGNGSSVLIIDTGVDYNHMALRDRFNSEKGYNFVANTNDPADDNGHGTHVAGIVAGKNTGVAPFANLFAAKVLNRYGVGSTTNIIRAVDYAIENDFQVANMSLGSPRFNYAFESICRKACNSSVCLVGAAGNDGYGPEYPASYPGVISVAALTRDNRHPPFSNIHRTVDISCPGVQVFSTFLGNDYKRCTGTSMATPHTAGLAALGYSVKYSLKPGDFEKALKESARELGRGESNQREKYGAGLAQANGIVEKLYKSVFGGGWLWR
ncbi:MAG: S8 family peptidase [Nanoarchaeota archaeon]